MPGHRREPLRVLVVEDNVDATEMLSVMLSIDGYQTAIAHDGAAAIEAARRFEPHVVLCDIGLPGMSGFEVAQQLRSLLGTGPTLVALTGYGQDEDRQRARDAGFDHHLVKPVEPHTLLQLLASVAG